MVTRGGEAAKEHRDRVVYSCQFCGVTLRAVYTRELRRSTVIECCVVVNSVG